MAHTPSRPKRRAAVVLQCVHSPKRRAGGRSGMCPSPWRGSLACGYARWPQNALHPVIRSRSPQNLCRLPSRVSSGRPCHIETMAIYTVSASADRTVFNVEISGALMGRRYVREGIIHSGLSRMGCISDRAHERRPCIGARSGRHDAVGSPVGFFELRPNQPHAHCHTGDPSESRRYADPSILVDLSALRTMATWIQGGDA